MRRSVARIGLAGIAVWLAASAGQAQEYSFARANLQCLLDNRAAVAAMTDPVLFLDISVCPPRAGGGGEGIDQSGTNRVTTTQSGLNAIIIIDNSRAGCYFDVVARQLATGADPIAIDFAACR